MMHEPEAVLQSALEALLDEDTEEAIYILRALADTLEEGADFTSSAVAEVLSIVTEYTPIDTEDETDF